LINLIVHVVHTLTLSEFLKTIDTIENYPGYTHTIHRLLIQLGYGTLLLKKGVTRDWL